MVTWPAPARSESATSTIAALGKVYSVLSNTTEPMPCSPGARKFSSRCNNDARLFGTGAVAETASNGNERNTTRPVRSKPGFGYAMPTVLPNPSSRMGNAFVPAVIVSDTSAGTPNSSYVSVW